METMRRISKRYYLRQMVIWALVNVMFFGLPFGAFAISGPGGYEVQGGAADIVSPGGNANATIDLLTDSAVIGWDNFNTIGGQSVTFDKEGMNFAVLNRISGGATSFYGNLYGNNGLVIVSNPAGIVFGGSAFVQARTFAAVGFDIAPEAFMAPGFDPLDFAYSGDNGDIDLRHENVEKWGWDRAEFQIDGTLALIGKNIYNKGKICMKDPELYSYVVMAAGDEIVISRENSHVNVDVSQAVDKQNWVRNEGILNTTGPGSADGEVGLVLAAGDIYSTAISGVESLRATARYDATFAGDIDVFADVASDAEAEVIITTGGNLDLYEDIDVEADGAGVGNASATVTITTGDDDFVINDDITAEAYTSGDFDATATIDITSTGKVTVEDGSDTDVTAEAYDGINNTASVSIAADGDIEVFAEGDNGDVTISADAYDGVNNSASVALAAQGDVTIKARKSDAIVTASAYNNGDAASVLNEAAVSITGKNVTIQTYYDSGNSDPAIVGAYASDAEENNAKVEITANGTEDDGDVVIKVEGDQDYALIEAEVQDGSDNSAQVLINATKDIDVKSDGDETGDVRIMASAHDGTNNNALIELNAGGDVTLSAEDKITVKAEAFGGCSEVVLLNQAQVNIDAGGSVEIKGQDYGESDNPAQVIAQAHDGQTNEAGIEILAGGDVLVTGEGREDDAIVSAKAYNGDENHATVVINAVGDVEILSDDYPDGSNGDGAGLVEALANNQKEAATLNEADVQITGNNVTIEDRSDGDDGVEVLAIAHNGQTNNATIGITANGEGEESGNVLVADNSAGDDDGVLVKAEAYDGQQNTATVTIKANGDVSVLANEGDAGILAYAHDGEDNTANVDITAGGNVYVKSEGGNLHEWDEGQWEDQGQLEDVWHDGYWDYDWVYGRYWNGHRWKTGWHWEKGDWHDGYWTEEWVSDWVYVPDWHSSFTPSVASVEAIAQDGLSSNTATVDVMAGADVEVVASNGGEAFMLAYAGNAVASENTANVNITAEDGHVLVHGTGGTYSMEDEYTSSRAAVTAIAECAGQREGEGTNSANIKIIAKDVIEPADTDGDVLVRGQEGGDAYIEAIARYGSDNSADVSIDADGDVEVLAGGCEAAITADAYGGYGYWVYDPDLDDEFYIPGKNSAAITLGTLDGMGVRQRIGGDVKVTALHGDAYIEAETYDGDENTSNVLICTEGALEVTAGSDYRGGCGGDKTASVAAVAHGEWATINTANVGVGAKAGVDVIAKHRGDAEIKSGAYGGWTNEAETIVCTEGDVRVIDICGQNVQKDYEQDQYDAEIGAEAIYGHVSNAYVGVCAKGDDGDIIVAAGVELDDAVEGGNPSGGQAAIRSKAQGWSPDCEGSTADATTVAVSKNGGVGVVALEGGCASVSAGAENAASDKAYTGVAAGGDLDLSFVPERMQWYFEDRGIVPSVLVKGLGGGSSADIWSYTNYGWDGTADTVICTPGQLFVGGAFNGSGYVGSSTFNCHEAATTQVYAGDGVVGSDIIVDGDAEISATTHFNGSRHCVTEGGELAETDGSAVLIIGSIGSAKDCPDCPPCPCEQPVTVALTAAAPMASTERPQPQDCPLLVQAATEELTGTGEAEAIDIVMENALAINPDINPCQACATLLDSAAILADVDGSRMAALAAVVGSAAAPDQPFDPAAELMIASAIAENANNAENPQYAFAGEFVDALVNYVAAAADLGIPAEDGTELVMAKYGAGLDAPENANVRAYVEARLAAMQ